MLEGINLSGNIAGIYRQAPAAKTAEHSNKVSGERKSMNEDRIAIRADYRRIADREFAGKAAGRILSSIQQEDMPRMERIEALKRQVAEGTYRMDAAAVADGMMRHIRGWKNAGIESADW